MAKVGQRIDNKELERTRIKAVEMVLSGISNVEVAEELGLNPHTITDWLTVFRRQGMKGLLWKGKRGRPQKLDDEQREELKGILTRGPTAYGYSIGLWTLPRVANVITKEFGITYHEAHVWKVLQSIGWSCQKPTKRALERDEFKIKEWKQKKWPAIKKSPERRENHSVY
jgi:transposase